MNSNNDGCPVYLKQLNIEPAVCCKTCRLEISPCGRCCNPTVFVHFGLPEGCPLETFFDESGSDGLHDYDVCDECGLHVCIDCQDNAKVGWGVFDALCIECGEGMKESDYKEEQDDDE